MPLTRSLEQPNHAPSLGKRVQIYIARLAKGVPISAIVHQTLTVAVAGAAKGATSVPLEVALTGPIFAGQYLCFADDDDVERLALVTADAAIGATSLTVRALDQAIAADSVAEFPAYLWDRTDASLDETFANSKTATFNTGGAMDGVPTTIERKITLPGIFWHYNAAFRTAALAADAQAFVYVERLGEAPNSAFLEGDSIKGRGLVTSVKRSGQTNNPESNDLEIELMGAAIKSDPKPTV